MIFSRPEALWALGLLPVLGLLCWWAGAVAARRRRRLLGAQADVLTPGFSRARRHLRDGLAVLAVGCVIVGAAGPLLGTVRREVEQRGVDVMVVLDTSRSMLAEDIEPSRLERAKRDIGGLLDDLYGHRMGLVTFAGSARTVVPLTHDASSLRLFLRDVDTTSNWTGGTAIGEGLELALDALEQEQVDNNSVIVLLTDGEDHDSDPPPQEVAYRAMAAQVPIHVVAVGREEGAPIPLANGRGGRTMLKDREGELVITRPDEQLLADLAATSGGVFLSMARTPFPLQEIHEKRIARMDGVSRRSRLAERGIDRYQWAVVAALAMLAARWLMSDRRPLP